MKRPNSNSSATRYLYEILLTITLASAFLTTLINSHEIYWNSQFFGWEMGLNRSFHQNSTSIVGQTLAFYLWSLVIAAVVFLLLRACSTLTFTETLLRTIAGIIVVAAPFACLGLVGSYKSTDPLWAWTWLRFEGLAAIGCALLYVFDRWGISGRTTMALLTMHSAVWVYAYWRAFECFGWHWLTVPVAAYLTTLVWSYYVKGIRGERRG